jgi:hypothetical protein
VSYRNLLFASELAPASARAQSPEAPRCLGPRLAALLVIIEDFGAQAFKTGMVRAQFDGPEGQASLLKVGNTAKLVG